MSGRAYHKLPAEMLRLAALAPARPVEAYDRAAGYLDLLSETVRRPPAPYGTVGLDEVIPELASTSSDSGNVADVSRILGETALAETERRTRELLGGISKQDPFEARWTADVVFARCCYLLCRLVRPERVVETGVAHGVSSAFLLAALRENGGGDLHSVDLPPLRREAGRFWGIAAGCNGSTGDTDGWHLHRGASRRVLPGLLRELGSVGLFVHDSLHTRRNMAYELDLAWKYLRPGGAILADDPERNAAFGGLSERRPALMRVIREIEDTPLTGEAAKTTFGLAIKALTAP
ncbi:class I SAM-dependent methyltransferase [Rubrobacter aplysinae]|uniref:class I SAM-dependent methyltransferase n=1 Tax=Rubrobacter aplysinae TaxID=909625 RepID=UPI00069DDB15|nr:class I SAM-dependent methyltransferase [Rubrobacter aplysinae]